MGESESVSTGTTMKTDARNLSVRAPAVAGLFYPGSPGQLGSTIDSLLAESRPAPRIPKALIVPHAGYVYSGPVAASAYGLFGASASTLRRAVILGPSHHHWFRGVALPASKAFETPLGVVEVDAGAADRLRQLPFVQVSDEPHAEEHSLEVQIPFLQRINPDIRIVPVLIGDATAAEVEEVIDALWDGPETLIVVSTDLSHYHSYRAAQTIDAATARAILDGRDDLLGDQACGCLGVNGLMRAVAKHGLHPHLLDVRNSGDTAGDKRRVVGYGAFGFYEN